MLKDIVLILILIIVILYILYYLKKEGFVNNPNKNIKFLTEDETYNFIHNDGDGYIQNLSPMDLYARKSKSTNDYRMRACHSAINFPDNLKSKIIVAINTANKLLEKLRIEHINCSEISSIPWILGMTKNKEYEDGLPHTRANIIFISSNIDTSHKSLVKLLIHEKIHIYQRLHPEEISYYLESKGYVKSKHGKGIPYVRSNPDLDGWIYISPITKKEMIAYYTSEEPASITDITLTDPSFEHPYELMAYTITDKILNL